jgi:transcriptional regulator with XRE-family HTH domain
MPENGRASSNGLPEAMADNGELVAERDKMADTPQNAAAGRFLVRARKHLELTQGEFAAALSASLGVNCSPSTVSGWETSTRSVPGAAIEAALALMGRSFDEELAEAVPASEVDELRVEVRKMGAGIVRALEAMAERPSSRTEATRRILDIALEIREMLATESTGAEEAQS